MKRVPYRALILGLLFLLPFCYLSVIAFNRHVQDIPATQISTLAILFALFLVVIVNPILNALKRTPLSRQEIFLIFIIFQKEDQAKTVEASLNLGVVKILKMIIFHHLCLS